MRRAALVSLVLAACSREGVGREEVREANKIGAHEQLHRQLAAPQPRPRPTALAHVTIKALGMYCEESCPLKVRTALADVPAVYELGFDVSTESIFVSFDAALGTPKDVTRPMLVAIRSAGFDPWLAKETWPADAQSVAQVMVR
ncbi:MAG TPA: hypothetical protein VM513_12545 [Kofleriaceae bacterium]|jgi:hypothetical protein|nr:hypothetical protein [Kofleriaceae bacterium]